MAGIRQPIEDVLTKLRELTVINGDGNMVTPHVRIWNNNLQSMKQGESYMFPLPAMFVEVLNDQVYQTIGQEFRATDLTFRVHILHEFYDAQDGTFEQDLIVYDLRDKAIAMLTYFEPTACGPLEALTETQDYDHDNIYHYMIDFVCHFIDSKGSRIDPDSTYYTEKQPPTDLQLNKLIEDGGGQLVTQKFTINK